MSIFDSLPQVAGVKLAIIGAVVGLFLVAVGVQTWRLHSAQIAIAESQAALAQMQADRDIVKSQRDQAIAANASMMRRIEAQNKSIAALQAAGQAREVKALDAARQVLSAAPKISSGHGPDAMNQWAKEFLAAP